MKKENLGRVYAGNIKILAKHAGIKLHDLEKELGVSEAYISRIGNRKGADLTPEQLVQVADILDVNVDYLLRSNMEELDAKDDIVKVFMDKLYKNTEDNSLVWVPLTKKDVAQVPQGEVKAGHLPLFKISQIIDVKDYETETESGSSEEVINAVVPVPFTAATEEKYINGVYFYAELSPTQRVYLTDVKKVEADGSIKKGYELFLVTVTGSDGPLVATWTADPLATTMTAKKPLAVALDTLRMSVKASLQRIHLKPETIKTIKNYVKKEN